MSRSTRGHRSGEAKISSAGIALRWNFERPMRFETDSAGPRTDSTPRLLKSWRKWQMPRRQRRMSGQNIKVRLRECNKARGTSRQTSNLRISPWQIRWMSSLWMHPGPGPIGIHWETDKLTLVLPTGQEARSVEDIQTIWTMSPSPDGPSSQKDICLVRRLQWRAQTRPTTVPR